MNESDLDTLERDMADYAEATGTDTEYFIATDLLRALISRLREAEQLAEDWRQAFHDNRLDLQVAQMHIAQLERVREAAQELVTPCEHERGFCIAHGTVRLPCSVADLAAELAALDSAK